MPFRFTNAGAIIREEAGKLKCWPAEMLKGPDFSGPFVAT
jgi:hypothetical protein